MSQSKGSLPRLFAELKRRKVFRVMAVYGAAAFVVLQVADLAFPALDLPEWTVRLVLLLTLLGFPIAVVLAWAFETTPEGVKRTEAAVPGEITEIMALPASRRWPGGLLALVGVVLLFGGGWWLGQRSDPEPAAAGTAPPVEGADAIPAKSVAVLPFVDLSEAGDQEWFADGLAEEILNSLAALPELRVTARTSSFQFRGRDRDITDIADTLGVAHVVEGSVRRIGDELVVTAQLIRAADGTHVWSSSYERSAEDLFDVQRDVAEKVATALDVFLDAEKREAMFRSGTRNVEAFEAYLRGLEEAHRWHAGEADSGSDAGTAEFERAMALDPGYAEAALAHMDQFAHVLISGIDIGISQEKARAALMRDLEFAAANAANPTTRLVAEINAELFSPTWHRMEGLIEQLAERPDVEQLRTTRTVWLGHVLIVADRTLARRMTEAEVVASPLDPVAWGELARLELADGDPDAALATVTRGRRLAGDHRWMDGTENVVAMRGDSARARAWALAMVEGDEGESEEDFPNKWRLHAYWELGDDASAAALTRRIDALPGGNAIFIQLLAVIGLVPFDLADAPNFAKRLEEAGIDLSDFGVPPDLARE